MFDRVIGLNILEELYKALLGLEMMMELDFLKCNSQYPKLMHTLAILMKFLRYK